MGLLIEWLIQFMWEGTAETAFRKWGILAGIAVALAPLLLIGLVILLIWLAMR